MSHHNPFLQSYQQARVAEVFTASPHKLIEMCLAGALERVAIAKGALQRGDLGEKARRIAAAIAIVEHLRLSLNARAGGDLAQNLDALYDYVIRRLAHANSQGDGEALDEVRGVLEQIKSGWDGLAAREVSAVTTPLLGAAA
jgi:flagellar protein FliS